MSDHQAQPWYLRLVEIDGDAREWANRVSGGLRVIDVNAGMTALMSADVLQRDAAGRIPVSGRPPVLELSPDEW